MDFTPLIKARRLLDYLWKEKAWLRGRCPGIKRSKIDNPYLGSNITMAIGEELVSVSQTKDGKLRIHEFVKTKNTELGKQVREIFKEGNLSLED